METEWIDRYVYAVGREFTEPQRSDIEKEIHSLIADMLEACASSGDPNEAEIRAVLTELGDPHLLADKYRDRKRYLIGPEIYPSYLKILQLVGMAISISMVVLFLTQSLSAPDRIPSILGETLTTFISACIQGFAWITVGFALAEHFKPEQAKIEFEEENEWKLSDLPELPEMKYSIPRHPSIWNIALALIFGIVVTFGVRFLGLWFMSSENTMTIVPFFSESVFRSYLPYFWFTLLLSLILEIIKYIFGRWTVKLSLGELVKHGVLLAVGVLMFSNPQIWNPSLIQQVSDASSLQSGSEGFSEVAMIWRWVTDYTATIIGLIYGIQIIQDGIHIFKMARRMD